MPHPLTRLTIDGYRSIKHAEVELGGINILLGPNSSGKSNFLSFFDLLRAVSRQNLQLYTAKNGGANQLFHLGTKITKEISGEVDVHNFSYKFSLGFDNNDSVFFSSETAVIKNGDTPKNSEEKTLNPGTGHRESELSRLFSRQNFSSWIVYHFHDTSENSPMKRIGDPNETAYLLSDGGNLSAYLFDLSKRFPIHYQEVLHTIRFIYPEFNEFVFIEDNKAGTLRMRWSTVSSGEYTFPVSSLSDGSLRFIAVASLLLQPELPSLLIIDEPELGLHPQAILILTELIRAAAQRSQIIISTQSVQLVSGFSVEDVLIVQSEGGQTSITRPDPETLSEWLEDYSLGDLWQKNLLGGNP